jgi:transposase InsO family protein
VESFHADNGAFHTETFQKGIDNKNQKLSCSGVNAQWQNGLVEKLNGTLVAAAHSMLHRAIYKWDKTTTVELWYFTIQHASTIFNTTKLR